MHRPELHAIEQHARTVAPGALVQHGAPQPAVGDSHQIVCAEPREANDGLGQALASASRHEATASCLEDASSMVRLAGTLTSSGDARTPGGLNAQCWFPAAAPPDQGLPKKLPLAHRIPEEARLRMEPCERRHIQKGSMEPPGINGILYEPVCECLLCFCAHGLITLAPHSSPVHVTVPCCPSGGQSSCKLFQLSRALPLLPLRCGGLCLLDGTKLPSSRGLGPCLRAR
jgi:hypothetical protein